MTVPSTTGTGPSAPRTRRGQRTRSDLEEAAMRLIVERGYLRVTIADITAAAGKSPAAFYRHYESKEQLLAALAEDFPLDVFDRGPRLTPGATRDPRFFEESARAYWESFRDNLGVLVGVSQQAQLDEDFARRWSEIRSVGTVSIERTVRHAQADGYATTLDAATTAVALSAMFEMFCFTQLTPTGADAHPVDDTTAVSTLAEIWRRTLYFPEESSP